MTETLQIFRCNTCGNIVQVLGLGEGELICCGNLMELLNPQTINNEFGEKHIPTIEAFDDKYLISLKSHPMTKEHYIEFIEVYNYDKSMMLIKYFSPNQEARLELNSDWKKFSVLAYCNIHGLWGNLLND